MNSGNSSATSASGNGNGAGRRRRGPKHPVNNKNVTNKSGRDRQNKETQSSVGSKKDARPSRPVKRFPIAYIQLEKAINMSEHSKLLLELTSESFGFLTLLEKSAVKPGMMCLILSAFAKIVDSPTDCQTRELLVYFLNKILPQNNDTEHFLKTALPVFIMNLPTYTTVHYPERERYLQAVFDLLKFMRKMQLIMLQRSRDIIRDLTPGLQAQIEFINRKGNCFADNTMELLSEVTESIKNLNATDDVIIQEINVMDEPPEDFRLIQICPNPHDILHNHEPYIRKNVVNGKYIGGVDHYLDVQFRLLREDFVRPLREGITEYLRLSKDKMRKHDLNRIKDVKVYNEVHVVNSVMRSGDLIFTAKFDTTEFKKVRWQVRNFRNLKVPV